MPITNIERIPKSITTEDLHKAIKHAKSTFPNECCGVFTHSKGYIACTIISNDPTTGFVMEEQERVAANYDDVIAIWHSHPSASGGSPSYNDSITQIATNLCWGVVALNDKKEVSDIFFWGSFENIPSLLDRQFRSVVNDAYSLVRDIYYVNLDIELDDLPREIDAVRVFVDKYLEVGFEKARKGSFELADVVLFQGDDNRKELGVIIDKDTVLTHEFEKASRTCRLAELKDNVIDVYRHKDVKNIDKLLRLF